MGPEVMVTKATSLLDHPCRSVSWLISPFRYEWLHQHGECRFIGTTNDDPTSDPMHPVLQVWDGVHPANRIHRRQAADRASDVDG